MKNKMEETSTTNEKNRVSFDFVQSNEQSSVTAADIKIPKQEVYRFKVLHFNRDHEVKYVDIPMQEAAKKLLRI